MELIIKLQVQIVSFFALMIIYFQLNEEKSYSLEDRVYKVLVLSTMTALIFESIAISFNGRPGEMAYRIHLTVRIMLFMIDPVALTLWTYYILVTSNRDSKHLGKWFIALNIPAVVRVIMTVGGFGEKGYYYIDANNLYHVGEAVATASLVMLALFMINLIVIGVNWKKIYPKNRIPMLIFLLPPFAGFGLYMTVKGTSLIWAGSMLAILMGYIMIKSQVIKTDYLTGLFNRRELDFYLDKKTRNLPRDKQFAGIMIDIDDFKDINDEHGHVVGDEAIKSAALLIKKACKRDDFVARYGGDEFIVMFDTKDENELTDKIKSVKRHFKLFNEKSEVKYKLEVSLGYGIYSWGDGQADEFIHTLDQRMYEDKKMRKSLG